MGKGIAYSIISAICLGSLAIFAKTGLSMGMAPMQIVQYRFSFGAIILFSWFALTNRDMLRISRKALLKAAVLGMCIYPLQSWLFIKALQHMPASTTSLIYYLYPLMTTLLAVVFTGLKPGRTLYLSLLLILGGCGLVFYNAFARSVDIRGIWYALACMTTFSVYLTVVQRFTRNDEAKRISLWVVFFMAVVCSCISSPLTILDQPLKGWLIALGLGILPTALAISLLYRAIEVIGSTYAAMFSTIEPVTTVLLAALLLNESVDAIQVCGMALIIAGIIFPNLRLIRPKRLLVPEESRA
ncbi:DMT family transporter [Pseudodesulfovibrio sp. zrk46]|uniref:DMT family transporter n=1 Tax=Pseudodesulfovibrio sp. zrk46 TaxID=2725288 RepID=UPI001448AD05|nr:DMT family transporter [Pseudodesulfovibrio sp. zrk46]QJB56932.1 DMT family transporter [Pseudodesulfovibrio sp. zrk46]